jgi:hypothetical protein
MKFEICESILFTFLKFVSRSMFYNDDGFLVNINTMIIYNFTQVLPIYLLYISIMEDWIYYW